MFVDGCILNVNDSIVKPFQRENSLSQLKVSFFKRTVHNNVTLALADCLLHSISEDIIFQVVENICFFEVRLEQQLLVADEVIGKLIEKTMPRRVKLNQDVIQYLFIVEHLVLLLPDVRVLFQDLLLNAIFSLQRFKAYSNVMVQLHLQHCKLQDLLGESITQHIINLLFLLVNRNQFLLYFHLLTNTLLFLFDLFPDLLALDLKTSGAIPNEFVLLLGSVDEFVGLIHFLLCFMHQVIHVFDFTICPCLLEDVPLIDLYLRNFRPKQPIHNSVCFFLGYLIPFQLQLECHFFLGFDHESFPHLFHLLLYSSIELHFFPCHSNIDLILTFHHYLLLAFHNNRKRNIILPAEKWATIRSVYGLADAFDLLA